MKEKSEEIKELLNKYLNNTHTPEELSALVNFIETSDDLVLFDEIAFDQWEEIKRKITVPDKERKKVLKKEARRIVNKSGEVLLSGERLQILTKAAAVLLIIIVIPVLIYNGQKIFFSNKTKEDYITTIIKPGEKKNLILSDETQVILNSESKFEIPKKFQANVRKVSLQGEAFFKVTHINDRPFIVSSDKVSVKVMGTSFNMKNYNDEKFMYVTLTTGKVAVTIGQNKKVVLLMPNEQLIIDKYSGSYRKIYVDANKYSLWTKGTLYFNSTPISKVVKIISRWYGKTIILNDTADHYLISGEHDNKSLNAVLQAISFSTGLKYKQIDDHIIVYK
ncbi:MAG TPA: FecR domain-containing protein [Bacteroidales bacterium]